MLLHPRRQFAAGVAVVSLDRTYHGVVARARSRARGERRGGYEWRDQRFTLPPRLLPRLRGASRRRMHLQTGLSFALLEDLAFSFEDTELSSTFRSEAHAPKMI